MTVLERLREEANKQAYKECSKEFQKYKQRVLQVLLNNIIDLQEMNDFLIDVDDKNGGIQLLFLFENAYGASIVKSPYSYGGEKGYWELAVIYYGRAIDPLDYELCYDTPITDDVIGWLDDFQVVEYLREIKNLPPRK